MSISNLIQPEKENIPRVMPIDLIKISFSVICGKKAHKFPVMLPELDYRSKEVIHWG